jgi:hypothetical protein
MDGFVALGFKWLFSNLIAGPLPPEAEAAFFGTQWPALAVNGLACGPVSRCLAT